MKNKTLRIAILGLFLLNLGLVLVLWYGGGSGAALRSQTASGVLIALGNLAGLVGFYLALWQLLLITRVRWIEKPWGHDKLSRMHHFVGTAALAAIGLHPILLSLGYSSATLTSPVRQFWNFAVNYQDVFLALVSYGLFLAIVSMAFAAIRNRLQYEVWHYIHFILYLAIILAFGHQLANGRDMTEGLITIYWQVLFYGVLVLAVYSRFIRPLVNFWRFGFRVGHIEHETSNVISLIIYGRNLNRLKARAGQFIIVRFLARGFWWQAHPFSLSEMPQNDRWRLTIKASGDFTSQLSRLSSGTRVIVEGPLGRFTAERAGERKVLLIAGGVGIAPLRALFEDFVQRKQPTDIIYSATTESDFALKSELNELNHRGSGTVRYLASNSQGYITPELIKEVAPDVSQRIVFLCGPDSMMKAVRAQLKSLGVPVRHIITEEFQLG